MTDTTTTIEAPRRAAWEMLGTTVPEGLSAQEALEHAGLARWQVRKEPLWWGTTDEPKRAEGRFATIRTNPVTYKDEYMGDVGASYRPIQNEEQVGLLDALVDQGGVTLDIAGAYRGGREVFVSMKLPEHMTVGDDRVDLNLIAMNSHDGSSSFRFLVSPVRVLCGNMQRAAIREARSSFSIRHTTNSGAQLQEAREALGLTFRYVKEFSAAAEQLLAVTANTGWVDGFLADVLGVKDEDDASRGERKHLDGLRSLYRESDTLGNIRGTRWGAYQTVTEYFDHIAPISGKGDKDARRALRTVTSYAVNSTKERAFTLAFA